MSVLNMLLLHVKHEIQVWTS